MKRKETLALENRQEDHRPTRFEGNGPGTINGASQAAGHPADTAHPSVSIEVAVQRIRLPFRLSLDRLDPYHGAGALIMTAGSLGMIASLGLGFGPIWAGFLVGAVPTFLIASLVHPEHA